MLRSRQKIYNANADLAPALRITYFDLGTAALSI